MILLSVLLLLLPLILAITATANGSFCSSGLRPGAAGTGPEAFAPDLGNHPDRERKPASIRKRVAERKTKIPPRICKRGCQTRLLNATGKPSGPRRHFRRLSRRAPEDPSYKTDAKPALVAPATRTPQLQNQPDRNRVVVYIFSPAGNGFVAQVFGPAPASLCSSGLLARFSGEGPEAFAVAFAFGVALAFAVAPDLGNHRNRKRKRTIDLPARLPETNENPQRFANGLPNANGKPPRIRTRGC